MIEDFAIGGGKHVTSAGSPNEKIWAFELVIHPHEGSVGDQHGGHRAGQMGSSIPMRGRETVNTEEEEDRVLVIHPHHTISTRDHPSNAGPSSCILACTAATLMNTFMDAKSPQNRMPASEGWRTLGRMAERWRKECCKRSFKWSGSWMSGLSLR